MGVVYCFETSFYRPFVAEEALPLLSQPVSQLWDKYQWGEPDKMRKEVFLLWSVMEDGLLAIEPWHTALIMRWMNHSCSHDVTSACAHTHTYAQAQATHKHTCGHQHTHTHNIERRHTGTGGMFKIMHVTECLSVERYGPTAIKNSATSWTQIQSFAAISLWD